ncbi:hypothetical protein GALMADRAFT_208127 [Galerina marginata CBS 339.88]|uniref:Uncharacterized protein n=1 Tax=Galerina marginata (strain CBS 339.88) TaxID=685588 RepID=A0A067TBV1_GALM3|nr:hypothetical protein GALMADRAFT_208127 [Galerina marginata CBS 339.88]
MAPEPAILDSRLQAASLVSFLKAAEQMGFGAFLVPELSLSLVYEIEKVVTNEVAEGRAGMFNVDLYEAHKMFTTYYSEVLRLQGKAESQDSPGGNISPSTGEFLSDAEPVASTSTESATPSPNTDAGLSDSEFENNDSNDDFDPFDYWYEDPGLIDCSSIAGVCPYRFILGYRSMPLEESEELSGLPDSCIVLEFNIIPILNSMQTTRLKPLVTETIKSKQRMTEQPPSPKDIAAQAAKITAMIFVMKEMHLSAFLHEDFRGSNLEGTLALVEHKLNEGKAGLFEFNCGPALEEANEAFQYLLHKFDPIYPR